MRAELTPDPNFRSRWPAGGAGRAGFYTECSVSWIRIGSVCNP